MLSTWECVIDGNDPKFLKIDSTNPNPTNQPLPARTITRLSDCLTLPLDVAHLRCDEEVPDKYPWSSQRRAPKGRDT